MLAALSLGAWAARPDDLVGPRAYTADDVLESLDVPSGRIRIHWSSAGPNVVEDGDTDGDGIPDYVAIAASIADEALALYEGAGFRPPIHESEFGLPELGGSDAIDVYLVDFGGTADGQFTPDRCQGGHCAGALIVENDFKDYGYPSDLVALQTVVPHELFHGVQMAYRDELEIWALEGQAVWSERFFRADSGDFVAFARVFLEEPTRPFFEPPIGPVPSFAYGTGLWFDYLSTRFDPAIQSELLEAWEADGGEFQLGPLLEVIEDRGDPIADVWTGFSTWNLATGTLAADGDEGIPGYEYATRLGPPVLEQDARLLDDDNRFYPLATTYYRLRHRGGPVWFGLEAPAPELVFSLHGVGEGGSVLPAEVAFSGEDATARPIADLPAGDLYFWGAQPQDAESSVKVRFCLGEQEEVAACFAEGTEPTDDTGGAGDPPEDGGGCGCASGAPGGGALAPILGAVLAGARRRRRSG